MALPTKVEPSILHQLAKGVAENGETKWKDLREKSLEELNTTAFPHKKIEEWRFTDLRPITRTDFVNLDEAGTLPATNIEQYFIPESDRSRLVFINGKFH
ncbi:MAG: hypothetical protein GVY20_07505, partial [Bacteroidetes bacterium]|nr:hypothetical protein [Bacteroidota bacterium]